MDRRERPIPARNVAFVVVGGVLVVLALGAAMGERWLERSKPVIPQLSSSVTVVHATPNVLVAVRDLARLETAQFHMERVIDLTEKQSHLFGLIQAEDAILLVAVADITAGVDLGKLTAGDVDADFEAKRVRIRLPAAEISSTALDPQRTYVHTRRTSTLARRQETLETRARQEAEQVLVDAAREAGILKRANENAGRVVEGLLKSLGYAHVEVATREASAN